MRAPTEIPKPLHKTPPSSAANPPHPPARVFFFLLFSFLFALVERRGYGEEAVECGITYGMIATWEAHAGYLAAHMARVFALRKPQRVPDHAHYRLQHTRGYVLVLRSVSPACLRHIRIRAVSRRRKACGGGGVLVCVVEKDTSVRWNVRLSCSGLVLWCVCVCVCAGRLLGAGEPCQCRASDLGMGLHCRYHSPQGRLSPRL